MTAFLQDRSEGAYVKVVDRLLASQRYGERWARHWLDIMRYADEILDAQVTIRPSFYRYRDWVIKAFNDDMPYDHMVKAQLAADLLPGTNNRLMLPALTAFVDQSTEFEDDERVDVVSRGFLGLSVACARCHDHKYDPIPTKDYYSLLGIFRSTRYREIPLASETEVANYQLHQREVTAQNKRIREFLSTVRQQVIDVLAARTADYLMAAWRVLGPPKQNASKVARSAQLDEEVLKRWIWYIGFPEKRHPYLVRWQQLLDSRASEEEMRKESEAFEILTLDVLREKRENDEYNRALTYGANDRNDVLKLNEIQGKSLTRDRHMLWQELADVKVKNATTKHPDARFDGVYLFSGDQVVRFLPLAWQDHASRLQKRLEELKKTMPPKYEYVSTIQDAVHPANLHVFIRGNPQNLGEEAPRGFLTVLNDLAPEPFTSGSGRRQLAEAIASPKNPLTARVIVNRVWLHHFGAGLVRTPSDFGEMGDRPANPELLDYLAARLMEQGWSLKKLHREILLSTVYRLSGAAPADNMESDPENRLDSWFPLQRLEAEALRDSMLFVAGALDEKMDGKPLPLADESNRRRTIYGLVSKNILDPFLSLFDFPSPNVTAERRIPTTVPSQRLFLLNSPFVIGQAAAMAARLEREGLSDASRRLQRCYQLLFQRDPSAKEMQMGLAFVAKDAGAWARYTQALMATDEFLYTE